MLTYMNHIGNTWVSHWEMHGSTQYYSFTFWVDFSMLCIHKATQTPGVDKVLGPYSTLRMELWQLDAAEKASCRVREDLIKVGLVEKQITKDFSVTYFSTKVFCMANLWFATYESCWSEQLSSLCLKENYFAMCQNMYILSNI